MRKLFLAVLIITRLGTSEANAADAVTSAVASPGADHASQTPGEAPDSMMGMHHRMMAEHMRHFPSLATDESAETLIAGRLDHGVFLAPEVKYARIRGQDSALLGGRAAWLLNHRVAIGGAGYMIANRIPAPQAVQSRNNYRIYYSLGYGGLLLGYVFAPHRLVHAEADVIVGGGAFGVMHSGMHGRTYEPALEPARFFLAEPELRVELNIAPYLRLGLGGGYRFVTGLNEIGLENRDVRGPSASTLLKLGIL